MVDHPQLNQPRPNDNIHLCLTAVPLNIKQNVHHILSCLMLWILDIIQVGIPAHMCQSRRSIKTSKVEFLRHQKGIEHHQSCVVVSYELEPILNM